MVHNRALHNMPFLEVHNLDLHGMAGTIGRSERFKTITAPVLHAPDSSFNVGQGSYQLDTPLSWWRLKEILKSQEHDGSHP